MIKNMKKADKTRKKIIDTFFELALKNNQLPNVSEICAELDIYRSTFYNYYSGIHDLMDSVGAEYKAILDQQFQELLAYTNQTKHTGTFDFSEALTSELEHFMKHRNLYAVFLNPEWCYSYAEYFREKIYHATMEIQGKETRENRYIAEFISAGTIHYLYTIIKNEETLSKEESNRIWQRINHLLR